MKLFDPTNPKVCDSDIEFECMPPNHGEENLDSVVVYTEREAQAYEREGYSVFAFPRVQR